jgi:hypothetical protein
MSFDDVAQRMQQRETTHPLTGYSTTSPDQYLIDMAASERRARKSKDLVIGGLLLTLGIIVTAGTYGSASESGGTYVIAYGPIIFGVIRLIRGLAG